MKLGAALGAAISVWIGYAVVSAVWFGASTREVAPYVYVPLLLLIGGWLGSVVARRLSARVTAVALLITGGWLLASVLLTALPGKLPIGYANANAALAVQLMALGGVVGLLPRVRVLGWLGLALCLLTVLANRSAAGLVVAIPVVLATACAQRFSPGRRRWPVAVMAFAVLTGVAAALVALARRAAWPPRALEAFDEVRRLLWLQAWGAFREAETFGRGPGSFEALNVLKDPDQSSAHSLPLQVAVELGAIGLGLLALIYLVGLAVAMRAPTPAQTWIAVAAWTALAVHSFVDHIVEYWPVPLAAGLVLGYGLIAQADSQPEHEVV